jgi:flagellar biosynthetic protein FliQ
MNDAQVIEVAREAIWVTIQMGTPVMVIGLLVGLVIALFQALTQIQELTLAFVPKIIAIFLTVFVLLPGMVTILVPFMEQLMQTVSDFGQGTNIGSG